MDGCPSEGAGNGGCRGYCDALEPAGRGERVYRTPSDDFELSRLDLAPGGKCVGQAAHGPDSIIVLDGTATLTARGRSILLARGAIVFVPFGTHYSLNAGTAPAMLFKASVPMTRVHQNL